MTSRAELIETAYLIIGKTYGTPGDGGLAEAVAREVLDAVLPQITTAEQLEALPVGSLFLGESFGRSVIGEQTADGPRFHGWSPSQSGVETDLRAFGPLTVVWQAQPEPQQEPAP